jgi:hypothetical protein
MNEAYVIAAPEMMAAAATDLATIDSDLSAAHSAAAHATLALTPAAADEVSAAVTHLFSQHAAGYQAVAAQAAAFYEQFVGHLTAGAHSYSSAEAVNVSWLLWVAQNESLYNAIQYLFQTLGANNPIFNPIFQILGFFVAAINALLGLPFLLLFLGLILGSELLNGFLLKFGI